MIICVFFISFPNKYFKKTLLCDSLVVTLNSFFLLRLLKTWHLYVLLYFPWIFQKLYYSSTWKNIFQNIFLHFFSCVFTSVYGFNQASSCLNFYALFSTLIYDLVLVLILCMYNIFVFSLCKMVVCFSSF